MKTTTVRMTEISIQNFKNVLFGQLSLENTRKQYKASITGLYGQNGSGKTALIDAVELLQHALCGIAIPDKYVDYINVNEKVATLCYEFCVNIDGKPIEVSYQISIKGVVSEEGNENTGAFQKTNQKTQVIHELLKCPILTDKQVKMGRMIDTSGDDAFTPVSKRVLLTGNNKETAVDLLVVKKLTGTTSKSFIFSREFLSVVRNHVKEETEKQTYTKELEYYYSIIEALVNFGNYELFVINTVNSGLISLNAQPLFFRFIEKNRGTLGNIMISLDQPSLIPEELKTVVDKVIQNMNIVLEQIIPGLTIGIKELSKQIQENGEKGSIIQLLSYKNGKEIALKNESEGIKKIISILQLLIEVYNRPSMTVAVDELDNGIFEYLLGELLRIISERGKGQLIFTSHNLRPLETLDRGFVAFTTINPNHRYIRLANVKDNNNVRDLYYRNIMLGEQKERLYETTNNSEIALAFREAGEHIGK